MDTFKWIRLRFAALASSLAITLVAVGRAPAHVIIDARGERAYVSNSEDNAMAVVDAARGSVVGSIPTAASPHGLRMSPDGREIYVVATKGNAVSVIDVATSKAVARIPVGKVPVQVGFTPDGNFIYVANQGTEWEPDNTVSVIETRRNVVLKTLATDRGAYSVVVGVDGNRVFIANTFAGTVSTIDTTTQRVVGTVPFGSGPGGITYRTASR